MKRPIFSQILSATQTLISAAIIYIIGCFCTPFVCAENIRVEAETSIIADFSDDDRGWLNATLVDNLNHPIQGQDLQIHVYSKDKYGNLQKIPELDKKITTDQNGHIEQNLALPVSENPYFIKAEYPGTSDFLGSDYSIETRITDDCILDFDVFFKDKNGHLYDITHSEDGEFPWIYDANPIKLVIRPKHIHCKQPFKKIAFLVSTRQDSIHVQISPGETETEAELHPDVFKSNPNIDRISFHITNLSQRELNFKSINHSVDFIYYHKLFKDEAAVLSGYIKLVFLDEVQSYIKDKYSFVDGQKLLLCSEDPSDCLPVKAYHENSKDLLYPFSQWSNPALTAKFYSNDTLIQSFDLNVSANHSKDLSTQESSARIIIIWTIGSLLFLGIILYSFNHLRRRKKIPEDPDKCNQSSDQVEEWPEDIKSSNFYEMKPTDNGCQFIFTDSVTRQPISLTNLVLFENQVELHVHHWPCLTKCHTQLALKHPDYVSWNGTFEHPGKHIISLISRRQYVIECFEAVCQSVIGRSLTWGKTTPNELCQTAAKTAKNIDHLSNYCTLIEKATFGNMVLTDDVLKDIRKQTMILVRR